MSWKVQPAPVDRGMGTAVEVTPHGAPVTASRDERVGQYPATAAPVLDAPFRDAVATCGALKADGTICNNVPSKGQELCLPHMKQANRATE